VYKGCSGIPAVRVGSADVDRQDDIDSLTLMRDLDFDVLVLWGATQDEPPVDVVSPAEAAERLEGIIQCVEAGGNR
jgi:hypothetical protein